MGEQSGIKRANKSDDSRDYKQGEKRPSFVILKTLAAGLRQQEIFLTNRDWPFASTSSLTEAIKLIGKLRPTYVLIPVDHPSRTVVKLPKLIQQVFNTTIIAYTERSSASALSTLQEWGMTFNLYPPISGPSILRMLSKIEKDKARALKDAARTQQRTDLVDSVTAEERIRAQQVLMDLLHSNGEFRNQSPGYTLIRESDKKKSKGKTWTEEKPAPSAVLKLGADAALQSVTSAEDRAMLRKGGQGIEKLGATTRMSCLIVSSKSFTGYLVMACTEQQLLDEDLNPKIREALKEYLQSKGESLEGGWGEILNLQIQSVPFTPWVKKQAEFMMSSAHDKQEIVMAFFPVPASEIQIAESYAPDMLQVELSDIRAESVLEFDIYLYLAANEKFVLYSKRGQILFHEQKKRLKDRGLSRVHIRKDSASDYRRYRAQRYFIEKTEIFAANAA